MLRFTLEHYGTGSVLTCLDNLEHVGAITYTRKIHRYESEADFSTIKTELLTYGEGAAYEIFTYFRDARKFNKTDRTQGAGRIGGAGLDSTTGPGN